MDKVRIGLGWRAELSNWLDANPDAIDCLEVTAEHFFDEGGNLLGEISSRYATFVHGLGLSLGTPGALDEATLQRFEQVARTANPLWVSEHISYTRFDGTDLGHLNPVPRSGEMVQVIADHAAEVAARCKKPIILENITSHLDPGGELSDTEFLSAICERAGCGLLIDVTNLFINAKNHKFDPYDWIRRIDPSHIVQLHIVGYSLSDGVYEDHHSALIQDDLMDLLSATLDHASVRAIILERDEDLQKANEIESELIRLRQAAGATHV
ncbi:MAG: DUF692 domain-containing protein [Fimbriimonadales bacterium]